MNSTIEILNQWGAAFIHHAGPMLWQSSLLIGVVAGIELAGRRKWRASFRHALWLVVLMKLC